MHAELARRRLYLHPIRWTSLGLSLIEAMQLGMPVRGAGHHRGGRGGAAGGRGGHTDRRGCAPAAARADLTSRKRPGLRAGRPGRPPWSATASSGSWPTGTRCWTGSRSRRRGRSRADEDRDGFRARQPAGRAWAGSTPAARTCTWRRWRRPGRARPRGRGLHPPATIRTLPDGVRLRARGRGRARDAGPAAPIGKDELLPYMAGFGAELGAPLGEPAAGRGARALLDERAGRPAGGATWADRPAGGADLPRAGQREAALAGRGRHQPAGADRRRAAARCGRPTGSSPPAPTRCSS